MKTQRHSRVGMRQQAVAGMMWLGGSRIAVQFLEQVFTVILVRLLAPGDYGLLAMAGVFTALFHVFADLGLARAVVQRADIDEEYFSTAFWANLAAGLFLFGLSAAVSPLVARIYGHPGVTPVLAALSLRFVFMGTNLTQGAMLSREMRFATFTIRSLISHVVAGVVAVALALNGAGVWALVAQALTVQIVKTVALWTATGMRPRRMFSWQKFKDLWWFGGNVLGSRFFTYVIKQSDNFLIGRALGVTLLGYYAFAYGAFLSPLSDIAIIVGRVTLPAFSRMQDDVERLRSGFLATTRYVSFFAVPAILGFLLVTPDLIGVVFGSKWLPAVPVLRVLLVAALLQSQMNIWATVFQALGRPDLLLKWSMVSAALYVPAFLIGLRWGIVGVAAGYTASTLVLVPAQLRRLHLLLRFQMRDYVAALRPVLLAAATMAAVVVPVQAVLTAQGMAPGARLLVTILIGAAAYMMTIWLVGRDMLIGLRRMIGEQRLPAAGRLAEEA